MVNDSIAPVVTELTLPAQDESTNDIVHFFNVTFSEDLNPVTAGNPAHYELRHAGIDGIFGTADDDLYPLQVENYISGRVVQFSIHQGPIQPGRLRFTVTPGVTDRAGNPVSPAFVRAFEVEELGIYSFESRANNSFATATPLVFRPNEDDPAGSGFRSAAGRGRLLPNENRDYWSFEGRAGDRLLLASQNIPTVNGTGLRFDLLRPEGNSIANISSWNGTEQTAVTLPVDGLYRIEVRTQYTYTGEYRFRVTLAPPSWTAEAEVNNATGNANTVNVVKDGDVYRGRVFGYIRPGGDLDVFSPLPVPETGDVPLFPLPTDTVIHATVRTPSSSPLLPTLEAINAAGTVRQIETGAFSLSYTIPEGEEGRHYLRVRAAENTGDLLSIYLLEFELLIPADHIPPVVSSVSLPAAASVTTAVIDRFQVTVSEHLMASSANEMANFELRHAGPDGVFGTEDDDLYPLSLSAAYASGTTLSFLVGDGPLQPGHVRFTVGTGLMDRSGNALEEPFVHEFAVEGVPGWIIEGRFNNTIATATGLGEVDATSFDRSFGEGPNIGTAAAPYWVSHADLNGDGHLDLVVANTMPTPSASTSDGAMEPLNPVSIIRRATTRAKSFSSISTATLCSTSPP